ncbi:MAG: hypothetical protein CMK53_01910 [Proteobacteria bacterium]|nr:hypothetical protein [Pseudomonadota bacterium]
MGENVLASKVHSSQISEREMAECITWNISEKNLGRRMDANVFDDAPNSKLPARNERKGNNRRSSCFFLDLKTAIKPSFLGAFGGFCSKNSRLTRNVIISILNQDP